MSGRKVVVIRKSFRAEKCSKFLYGCLTMLFVFLLLLISATPTLAATKKAKKSNANQVKKIEISNLQEGYVLPLRKTMNLTITTPQKKRVPKGNLSFLSSNKKVITVDRKGKLKVKKKGYAYITVRLKSNKKVKCKVKVFAGKRIKKLSFVDKPSFILNGDTYQMAITASPVTASNKHLEWSSSDPDVAAISPTGLVKAINPGYTIITAKAVDGSGKKISCKVKVMPKISSIKISYDFQYSYIEKGSSIRLKTNIMPSDTGQTISWVSTKPDIASVDNNGKVTGMKSGKASVYAVSADGRVKSNVIEFTVTNLDSTKVKVIAHRGYMGIAPENSKIAFEQATWNNFWGIECDIWQTKDGVFVVQHDNNLKRLFGKDILISESTYDDIKDLKYISGSQIVTYPNERILKIEDYMEILSKSDKRAVIELKQDWGQEEINRLYDVISSYGINDRVDIISPVPSALLRIENAIATYGGRHDGTMVKAPKLVYVTMNPREISEPLGNITPLQFAINHGYDLDCHFKSVTADTVAAMHEAGLKVGIFEVNTFAETCHFVYNMHIDFVTSAYPVYH